MTTRSLDRRESGFTRWINKESTAGVIFSLPFIIGFLMFLLIPMVLSLYYSFCKYDIQNPPTWIGLDNYIKIFTKDKTFTKALGVTVYFALIGTPLKVIFALIVALILNHESRAVGFYRATYYLPSIIGGSVAVAILWRRMFESNGTINAILGQLFPGMQSYNWFAEGPAIWVLQPGAADHQLLPGLHPVQADHQRRPPGFDAVLYGVSVQQGVPRPGQEPDGLCLRAGVDHADHRFRRDPAAVQVPQQVGL